MTILFSHLIKNTILNIKNMGCIQIILKGRLTAHIELIEPTQGLTEFAFKGIKMKTVDVNTVINRDRLSPLQWLVFTLGFLVFFAMV